MQLQQPLQQRLSSLDLGYASSGRNKRGGAGFFIARKEIDRLLFSWISSVLQTASVLLCWEHDAKARSGIQAMLM